jgi:hypothetical protein
MQNKKPLVHISVPSRSKGFWQTYTALLTAIGYAGQNGILCTLSPHVGSSLICRARQNTTYEFLFDNPNADYFFQVDDDVQLPRDGIVKLINAKKNVVGGMYALKSNHTTRLALRAKGDKYVDIKTIPNQLVEIQYLSTGCFMQTRDVVQRAWDYYKKDRSYTVRVKEGVDAGPKPRVALYTPYIYKDEYLSEDWAYCQRLIDMGEKIWLHTGVPCGHWGMANYGVAITPDGKRPEMFTST